MTLKDVQAIARGMAPFFQAIATRLAALEVKERGLDGAVGPRGADGPTGRDGRDGIEGPAGATGPKGKDGRDAVIKGAFALKQIDERTFRFCWDDGSPIEVFNLDGTRAKSGDIYFPIPLYKDVFDGAKTYAACDSVTYGGSMWIAKTATSAKPGEGSPDWTLAIKRGREGKEGKVGPEGKPGRDLTSMDSTGRKWG